jgi:hypothetical protein
LIEFLINKVYHHLKATRPGYDFFSIGIVGEKLFADLKRYDTRPIKVSSKMGF